MTGGASTAVGYELPGLTGAPRALVAAARAAEAAGVDYLVLPDRPAAGQDGAGPPAAMVTAALLAARTTAIGLVVTAATAYYEPYHLARLVASLDHVSSGRAGWQVVTAPDAAADANHRREGVDPAIGREARAAEYVPLIRDLWDSWEDGAFVHDKATGRFVDGDRIHVLDHVGPALRVRGPLNLIRPPQGHPVVFAPATDPLVAPAADVLTVGDPRSGGTTAHPGSPKVLVVVPFVAETAERARELHARAGAPESDRDLSIVVGDPAQVAERLLSWADGVAGFTVRFPAHDQVAVFTEQVLPRLRAAVPPRPASPRTLRARLCLAKPANRVAGERS